ncbi:MAG: M20 family metallopeptidase [Planctomycetota bacterium]|nr:M20 family metallopeptidase [Planctomycetota bacterium]
MADGDPQNCVELLRQMIGFDTVNRTADGMPFVEGQLAAYLETVANGWGLQTSRLAIADVGFNLLVTHQTDPAVPWLLFDSHLDTVDVAGMTIDPFGGKVADGKIFGRGACDTKGTGAAMLWALKDAVADGQLSVNVAILYSIDEEVGRRGVRAFVDDQLETLGWRPVGVVVGEPTSLRLVTAHNGTVRWRIRTRGVAAHSSDPRQGRSAISSMTRVIDAIEQHYIPTLAASHPLVGHAQCSINLVRGGSLINVIPESCEIRLDRRTVPGEDGTDVLPAVEAILDELRQQHPDLEVYQEAGTIEPALSPDTNQEFAHCVGCVLESLKFSRDAVGAKYGTHASNFASAGLPAIVLGPGDIAQAHSADEFLSLDQLQRGVEVYRQLMLQPANAWR